MIDTINCADEGPNFDFILKTWFRPNPRKLSKGYIFSSEKFSLSALSISDWVGPYFLEDSQRTFPNCFGLVFEVTPGIVLSYPAGQAYSTCNFGDRLLTLQVPDYSNFHVNLSLIKNVICESTSVNEESRRITEAPFLLRVFDLFELSDRSFFVCEFSAE